MIKKIKRINQYTIHKSALIWLMKRNVRVPFYYMLLSKACAGKGYVSKADFINLLTRQKSKASAYRIIRMLQKYHLCKERNQTLVIRGKNKLRTDSSRTVIFFTEEDLQSIECFNKNTLLQIAIVKQSSYRYAFRKSMKEKDSFKIIDGIDTKNLRIGMIGVSFSKIAETLGISKSYCHSVLKSLQNKQLLHYLQLSYKEFVQKGIKDYVDRNADKFYWQYLRAHKCVRVSIKLSSTYPVYYKNRGERP